MILFTDNRGIKLTFQAIKSQEIEAIVGACIRPQYFQALKQISKEINVPFLIQPKINEKTFSAFIKKLKDFSPDLFFINSYSMILNHEILRIPKKGTLNIHTSLLPKNRGCNPIQWGIINNEKYAGATLHEVDTGIDTGPIIDQRKTKIFFEDTWLSVSDRIDSLIIELMRNNLKKILNFDFEKKNQNKKESSCNKRRKVEDGFFSWDAPVIKIYNLIRALVKPLPGARYIIDGDQKVIDKFLNISEVTFLKYEKNPLEFKLNRELLLRPCRNLIKDSDVRDLSIPNFIIFYNKLQIGLLKLIEINWSDGSATFEIIYENEKLVKNIQLHLKNFFLKEFNLKLI